MTKDSGDGKKRKKMTLLASRLKQALKRDMKTQEETKAVRKGPAPPVNAEPPKQPPTLFIRHLPVAIDEEGLRERFSVYGEIKRCFLVMNRHTGHPNGNAFIHFVKAQALKKALNDAEQTAAMEAKDVSPEADAPKFLYIQGSRIEVMAAVDRDTVGKIEAARKEKDKKDPDPRHLSLLREGVFLPDTPATKSWPKQLLESEIMRHIQKRRQLKNPNYCISPTRLCIRHLPPDMTESTLRRIVMQPVKAYLRATTGRDKKAFALLKNRDKESAVIRQVKICRDPDKQARSRGFGFVQFNDHNLALVALRSISNNPNILPKHRLIVEFAIDKVQALKLQERRRQRFMEKQEASTAAAAAVSQFEQQRAEPQRLPSGPVVFKLQPQVPKRKAPEKQPVVEAVEAVETEEPEAETTPREKKKKGKQRKRPAEEDAADTAAGNESDNDERAFFKQLGADIEEHDGGRPKKRRRKVAATAKSADTWVVDADEYAKQTGL